MDKYININEEKIIFTKNYNSFEESYGLLATLS